MERLPKRTRKISTAKALGLDTKDPSDKNYLRYENLLLGLRKIMRRRGVSGNKLAKMMGISRQAIYDRFAGRNTTLEWISRVAEVLGISLKVSFIESSPRRHAAEIRKVA